MAIIQIQFVRSVTREKYDTDFLVLISFEHDINVNRTGRTRFEIPCVWMLRGSNAGYIGVQY